MAISFPISVNSLKPIIATDYVNPKAIDNRPHTSHIFLWACSIVFKEKRIAGAEMLNA